MVEWQASAPNMNELSVKFKRGMEGEAGIG
jgi:hypothetical protein